MENKNTYSIMKEKNILKELIKNQEPRESSKWKDFFSRIECYTRGIFNDSKNLEINLRRNEGNLFKIIEIIWDKKLHKNKWDNDVIFEPYFRDIAITPVYLPMFFQGFLSGIFLIHVLHGKKIEFYREEFPKSIKCTNRLYRTIREEILKSLKRDNYDKEWSKEKFEEEVKNQLKDKQQNIDSRNYTQFYGQSTASYLKQFQNTTELIFDNAVELRKKANKNKNKNFKNTKSWSLFSAMDYINFYIFKKEKEHKLLNILNRTCLDPFDFFDFTSIEADKNKLNILVLKTIMIGHIMLEENAEEKVNQLSHYNIMFKSSFASIIDYIHIISLLIINASHLEKNNKVYNKIFDILDKSNIESKNENRIKLTDNNLFFNIIWEILGMEQINSLKTILEAFDVNLFYLTDNQKNEIILSKKMPDFFLKLKNPMKVHSFKSFYEKYVNEIKILMADIKINKLKLMWLRALKVIAYCYPEKHNYSINISNIPSEKETEKLEKWLKENKIFIENIELNEMFSTIQLINVAIKISLNATKLPEDYSGSKLASLLNVIRNLADDGKISGMKWLLRLLISNQRKRCCMNEKDYSCIKVLYNFCFKKYLEAFYTSTSPYNEINIIECNLGSLNNLIFILENILSGRAMGYFPHK